MKRIIIITLLLAGCGSTPLPPAEPVVITKVVSVPVPVPCATKVEPPPTYPATPEALKAARDIFARSQLVVAELVLRRAREAELLAVITACGG